MTINPPNKHTDPIDVKELHQVTFDLLANGKADVAILNALTVVAFGVSDVQQRMSDTQSEIDNLVADVRRIREETNKLLAEVEALRGRSHGEQ